YCAQLINDNTLHPSTSLYLAVAVERRRRPTSCLPWHEQVPPLALTLPDVWPEVSAGLDREAVRAALDGLSDVQRHAIELAYFRGLTQQEISERTDTPLGTVKSRMRLGLLAMRRTLVGDGSEVEGYPTGGSRETDR